MNIRFQRKDRNKQLMTKANSKFERKVKEAFITKQLKKRGKNNESYKR
ncbi:hypothetical protein pW4_115 [Bacillus phage pW4]|uniref:Uncharacterized protein n=1 Tax=Bacillus phage pW4 TaxID=2500560 RepID=A0A3Q9R811_9CAUD|nr:hypothetical protein PP656_gp030 [Bacillus phage pW4]AZU99124.1 hypothetical protein pW4_115 [Bacillus phage pW4]